MPLASTWWLCYEAGQPQPRGQENVAAGMRPIVIGNWKMNGLTASLSEIGKVAKWLETVRPSCDVAVCPPATLISKVVESAGGVLAAGGQDCHWEPSGAYTGDISAEMLADCGCQYVIVGHSERRSQHGESNASVRRKAKAAHRAGLISVICVGETIEERQAGHTLAVVGAQLDQSIPEDLTEKNTIVAYEPVWAIGTGLTPSTEQVREVHAAIRQLLSGVPGRAGLGVRILYGGSVKPSNAKELLGVANVNGALVGGASLKADEFTGILRAYT